MLGKLFKYEMKYSSPLLLLLHGILLAGALALFGLGRLPENFALQTILLFSRIAWVLLALASVFAVYIGLGMRFYRTVFSDQGYLTNTLPATTGQILLSRFLTIAVWSMADLLILLFCLVLVTGDPLLSFLSDSFGLSPETDRFLFLLIPLLLVSMLLTIVTILCCVTIGNLFGGHKAIGSVIGYVALQTGAQVISLLPLPFFLAPLMDMPQTNMSLAEMQAGFPEALRALTFLTGAEIFLYFLAAAAYYALAWYLMDRKLNLE